MDNPLVIQEDDFHILPSHDSVTGERLTQRLLAWQEGRQPAFLRLLGTAQESLELTRQWEQTIRQRASRVVLLGIGGSSLGGEMLASAHGNPEGLPVRFCDNVDPRSLASLSTVDWRETFLLVISKSGGTAETLSQFLSLLPTLERLPDLKQRVCVVTGVPQSPLGRMAKALELPILPFPEVGGRFSVLSVVGLLPAALAGVPVERIMAGALAAQPGLLDTDPERNRALRMALSQFHLSLAGRSQSVWVAYGDHLHRLTAWYAQLCAESLGKIDQQGQHRGLTPLSARGVTDQHSVLQLFLDGPRDKQFTLLFDPELATEGAVAANRFPEIQELALLANRPLGQLFTAEFHGTRDTLIHQGLPVRTVLLPASRPEALGALILQAEVEIALLAEMFHIDAYDQPAVEESKIRAMAYLAK
ncbi:MAG: glucose-6-phosphate isomerase [Magnetococcales bacterium]|nr:glucose-6-phosphate isomerase [Magnetococcales bacterium]